MNILLVAPWDQEFGGVASVVGNLAKHLEQCEHRVIFLHPGEPDRPRRQTTRWGFVGYEINLRAPFIRKRPIRSVVAFVTWFGLTLYRLWSLLRLHRIEIVNVHYPIGAFVYFGVLRWFLPIRLVVSVHGADMFPGGQWPGRYPRSLTLLVRSSDAIVAPSRAFLQDFLSVFPATAQKALVVCNGVDIEELRWNKNRPEPEGENCFLLCIAAHNEKKALDVLLKAFAQVSQVDQGLRLVLVGDGPLRRQHEELAKSLGLKGRVDFLGSQGRTEVARLLRHCRVFVLPSRSEPFGLVITEALACRKPVVASAVGGIPEIIEHGRSGILVEADNPDALAAALLTVLADEALRESIANRGHKRVIERFDFRYMGARYERLYSELLRGVSPAASAVARESVDG